MADFYIVLAAYFIGAIPFAYLFGRLLKHADIRQIGSGNVGAMNTFKHIGYLPGVLTLLTDMAKGFLAVHLATSYGSFYLLPLFAMFMVVLGHNYNVFLGFKGGKGLACLLGAMLLISPITILYVLGLIILIVLIIRDTNTAAGLGIIALPVVLGLQKGHWLFAAFGLAVALLVLSKYPRDFRAYRAGRRRIF
jgi:acyl phosphate:glycerol-3-phosphate acyltransferase